jgi:precorrin-6Y C5,15-methyltransferase (decarboxylating)
MIYIIGLGIEGKSSLSQRALTLIKNANILIGGKRHLASFPEFKGRKVTIGSNLEDIAKILNRKSEIGNRKWSVVLATGDPNFFGIADFMIKNFGKNAVEIIPNVSTVQEAFARVKENWNDARFISVHGRNKSQKSKACPRMHLSGVKTQNNEGFIEGIVDEIVCYDKMGIFTDPDNTPSKIAKALIEKGIKDYHAYVCEDLGTDNEKITEGTLAQITRKKFSPLNVMLLIKKGQGKVLPTSNSQLPTFFGIPNSEFSHPKGMITKEEIRVISLSKLKLKTDSITWDIGAGAGSLSIEAAMLTNNGKVFAVEKDVVRIRHIERNKKKFNAANLEIIHKNAPHGLKNLPAPDAVFIGGGGKDVAKILDVCSKRLKQGGRIIVNAITLETLAAAAGFFKSKGWNTETISVNIAKTKLVPAGLKQGDVASLHLFNAYNPVFVVVGEKK